MPVHDAFGLTGSPGGVDDFDYIVRRYSSWNETIHGGERGERIHDLVVDNQFWLRSVSNAAEQILREAVVDRDRFKAARNAGPEHRHPFEAVFRPYQHAVAFSESSAIKMIDAGSDSAV